jgi:hypothetical protein
MADGGYRIGPDDDASSMNGRTNESRVPRKCGALGGGAGQILGGPEHFRDPKDI